MNFDFEEILSFSIKSLRKHLTIFLVLFFIILVGSSAFVYLLNKPVYTMQFSASSSFLSNSDITTQFDGIQSLIDSKNDESLAKILKMKIEEVHTLKGIKAQPHDKTNNFGNLKISLIGNNQAVLESFASNFENYLLQNEYIKKLESINMAQTQFAIDQLKEKISAEENTINSASYININNNNIVEMINTLNSYEKKMQTYSTFSLTDTPTISVASNSVAIIAFSVTLFSLLSAAFLVVFTLFSKQYYDKVLK